jgi:hypothetical protein
MGRINFRAGTCACGIFVKAEGGFVENVGGNWLVKCKTCGAERADAQPIIAATMLDGEMMLKPVGFLGGGVFDTYRTACSGARYNGNLRAQIAPMAIAATVVAALIAAKFIVNLAPDVAASIQAHQASVRAEVADVTDRADAVDALLATRGLALFGFQRHGVKWLASRDLAILADDMGLGKTIQALIALPKDAAVLVIAPAIAKGVWAREAAKWRPDMVVTMLSGRGSFRAPKPGEIVVTNYDILSMEPLAVAGKMRRCEAFIPNVTCPVFEVACTAKKTKKRAAKDAIAVAAAGPCDSRFANSEWHRAPAMTTSCPVLAHPMTGAVIVADEAHNLKNKKTARSKAFCKLADPAREGGGKVWLLTATPILNRPQELWTLLEAAGLAYEAFGGWKAFAALFHGVPGSFGGWTWGTPEAEAIAPKLARVMLRRSKKEVLKDLPAKIWSTIPVDIDATTMRLLDEVNIDEIVAAIKAGESLDFKKLSAARAAIAKAKIPAMLEVVESYEEQGEPLVVFSAHVAPIEALAKREGWAIITGATSNEKRTEIEEAFQAGKLRGVGCTIKAGGVAITLTKAANALFVDKEWTPSLNVQAEDRIYRIGQTRGVQIISLVGDHPIEHRIAELLEVKDQIITLSVEAARTTTAPNIEMVELDFAAIDEAARVEAAKGQAAIDAAQARADAYAALVAALPPEQREGFGGTSGGPGGKGKRGKKAKRVYVAVNRPGCRPAATEQEVWAARGLQTLSDLDPDRARTKNDVGFNAPDANMGHMLAVDANAYGLTDEDWKAAVAICGKYWRQIGKRPELSAAEAA